MDLHLRIFAVSTERSHDGLNTAGIHDAGTGRRVQR